MAETVKGRPKDGSPSSTSRVCAQRLKSDENVRLSANIPAKAVEVRKAPFISSLQGQPEHSGEFQVSQHTGVQLSVGRT